LGQWGRHRVFCKELTGLKQARQACKEIGREFAYFRIRRGRRLTDGDEKGGRGSGVTPDNLKTRRSRVFARSEWSERTKGFHNFIQSGETVGREV
jgi:hypothetical protein